MDFVFKHQPVLNSFMDVELSPMHYPGGTALRVKRNVFLAFELYIRGQKFRHSGYLTSVFAHFYLGQSFGGWIALLWTLYLCSASGFKLKKHRHSRMVGSASVMDENVYRDLYLECVHHQDGRPAHVDPDKRRSRRSSFVSSCPYFVRFKVRSGLLEVVSVGSPHNHSAQFESGCHDYYAFAAIFPKFISRLGSLVKSVSPEGFSNSKIFAEELAHVWTLSVKNPRYCPVPEFVGHVGPFLRPGE